MHSTNAGPTGSPDHHRTRPGSGATDPDPDAPVRGRIRGGRLRRVCFGLGVRRVSGRSPQEERWRDLRAYLAVAPAAAVFTGLTGAELLGWDLPKVPAPAPVFMAVGLPDPRPRRQGLVVHRLTRQRRRLLRHGLPVDEPEEVLLAAARYVDRLDLLILVESALRHDDIDQERMTAILDSARPGVRNLRWAWRRAAHTDSVGESVLCEFDRCIEVAFETQVELYDEDGHGLGRADLLVSGTKILHEYDGAHHRSKKQQQADLRRSRGLVRAGYERHGYTLDDLLNHALVVMHEVDRALDRPHRTRGLERWHALVEGSLYADTGRVRLMHRWRDPGSPAGPVQPSAA